MASLFKCLSLSFLMLLFSTLFENSEGKVKIRLTKFPIVNKFNQFSGSVRTHGIISQADPESFEFLGEKIRFVKNTSLN